MMFYAFPLHVVHLYLLCVHGEPMDLQLRLFHVLAHLRCWDMALARGSLLGFTPPEGVRPRQNTFLACSAKVMTPSIQAKRPWLCDWRGGSLRPAEGMPRDYVTGAAGPYVRPRVGSSTR